MKLKEGFVLHKVREDYVALPTGELSKTFDGLVRNNAVSAFLFEQLFEERTEEELIQALLAKYEVEESRARLDVAEFVEKLLGAGILE